MGRRVKNSHPAWPVRAFALKDGKMQRIRETAENLGKRKDFVQNFMLQISLRFS
jgi:hypothetical protein